VHSRAALWGDKVETDIFGLGAVVTIDRLHWEVDEILLVERWEFIFNCGEGGEIWFSPAVD